MKYRFYLKLLYFKFLIYIQLTYFKDTEELFRIDLLISSVYIDFDILVQFKQINNHRFGFRWI